MSIQLLDQRPALTLAIAQAKAADDPNLPQWEADLTRMVAEVTRKFHGSLTAESVRRGLETAVGLLSIGLLHAAEGDAAPERLYEALVTLGILGASKRGVGLVKECHSLPESGFLFEEPDQFGTPLQELLLQSAKGGYSPLMKRIAERQANRREIDLARWLLLNSSVGRLVRRNREGTLGDTAMADELITYVLLRECGAPIPEDELAQSVSLAPKPRAAAWERYLSFVEKIPGDLKPALFHHGESWFERVILPTASSAPAKGKATAKKTAPKAKAKPAAKTKAASKKKAASK